MKNDEIRAVRIPVDDFLTKNELETIDLIHSLRHIMG